MRILTFDLEDWFHLLEFPGTESIDPWSSFEARIEHGTDLILETLDRHGVRATFFCLGWIAERHPAVIRRIDAAGHEFGTHGHGHRLIRDLTPETFEADLVRSLAGIEQALGRKVRHYRAPGFSITPATTWALPVLLEHGIEVDSSIFPTWRAHGGYPAAIGEPCWLAWSGGRIRELPLAVGRVGGVKVPFSGGGYFRLMPYEVSRRMIRQSPYVMTYFHPRDFDADQPRMPGLGAVRRFRAYVGLGSALEKLRRLLTDFEWVDVETAVRRVDWDAAPAFAVTGAAGPASAAVTIETGRDLTPDRAEPAETAP